MKRFVVVFTLLLAACSADLTLPPKIDGTVPPAPSNFTVATSDQIDYDLTWTIGNPTVIRFYHLYIVDPFMGPVFVDTTASTSVTVSTTFPTPGVVFGVSSVSTDNIESQLVFGSAP